MAIVNELIKLSAEGKLIWAQVPAPIDRCESYITVVENGTRICVVIGDNGDAVIAMGGNSNPFPSVSPTLRSMIRWSCVTCRFDETTIFDELALKDTPFCQGIEKRKRHENIPTGQGVWTRPEQTVPNEVPVG